MTACYFSGLSGRRSRTVSTTPPRNLCQRRRTLVSIDPRWFVMFIKLSVKTILRIHLFQFSFDLGAAAILCHRRTSLPQCDQSIWPICPSRTGLNLHHLEIRLYSTYIKQKQSALSDNKCANGNANKNFADLKVRNFRPLHCHCCIWASI